MKWLALLLVLSGAHLMAADKPLHIAVASNFRLPLQQLLADYPRPVRLSSAATGVLYQQIRHGAPFDIFFAADSDHPQRLYQQQLALAPVTYAIGELVLWAPEQRPDLHYLARTGQRLALANPRHAPYGKAAMAVLRQLGLDAVARVYGGNVNQAFHLVSSGNVAAGLVAYSQIRQQGIDEHQIQRFNLPQVFIRQQLVVLRRSRHQAAARALLSYLDQPARRQQLVALGYRLEHASHVRRAAD